MNYQEKINVLFQEQSLEWGLLHKNLEALKMARIRIFYFEGFTLKIQFNPHRILSSSAKVDKESVSNRKCFLCLENRPTEQKCVSYDERYHLLCNPYPIFERHFTISHIKHKPQEISMVFGDFLKFSRDFPELVVFYNAPSCGASAPDHLHFQAGNKGLMPVERELSDLLVKYNEKLIVNEKINIHAVDDGLRKFFHLESDRLDILESAFQSVHEKCRGFTDTEEPMLNILSYYRKDRWSILIFFRERHRPWQYFVNGLNNILLSPAAVDYGGILITPLENDFNRISKGDIISIFRQTSLARDKFEDLKTHMKAHILIL